MFPRNCSLLIDFFTGPYYFSFLLTPKTSQLVQGLLSPETMTSAFSRGVLEVTLYHSWWMCLILFSKQKRLMSLKRWMLFSSKLLLKFWMYQKILVFSLWIALITLSYSRATQGSKKKRLILCFMLPKEYWFLILFYSLRHTPLNYFFISMSIDFRSLCKSFIRVSLNASKESSASFWCCFISLSASSLQSTSPSDLNILFEIILTINRLDKMPCKRSPILVIFKSETDKQLDQLCPFHHSVPGRPSCSL